MKDAKLGDYLLWDGVLAEVVSEYPERSICIEIEEQEKCPCCEHDLGKRRINVISRALIFQNSA